MQRPQPCYCVAGGVETVDSICVQEGFNKDRLHAISGYILILFIERRLQCYGWLLKIQHQGPAP